MTFTRDPDQFFRSNHHEILKLLRAKLGSHVADEVVEDHAMTFYHSMIKHKILAKYDPLKGSFEQYICTALYWPLHRGKRYDQKSRDLCEEIETADESAEIEDEAWRRINEFKRWLIKYGHGQITSLMEHLQNRLDGNKDYLHPASSTYNAIMSAYCYAENSYGCTGIYSYAA